MIGAVLGGVALLVSVVIAVDFLLGQASITSEERARRRLYELWIRTRTLTVYIR